MEFWLKRVASESIRRLSATKSLRGMFSVADLGLRLKLAEQ